MKSGCLVYEDSIKKTVRWIKHTINFNEKVRGMWNGIYNKSINKILQKNDLKKDLFLNHNNHLHSIFTKYSIYYYCDRSKINNELFANHFMQYYSNNTVYHKYWFLIKLFIKIILMHLKKNYKNTCFTPITLGIRLTQ